MGSKGGALAGLDLSLKLTDKQEVTRLAAAQARLLHLRLVLGGQVGDHAQLGPPVCVVFEGWDASGKGGAIKRLVAPLDPRHVRVAQFGAPSYDEKRHHFLWRFWPVLPGWGGMAVLDRSWYGRVLVERVEGFATEEQWRRAYREIVGFERTLADEGMIIVKFWLHLSSAEQLRRFKAREREQHVVLRVDLLVPRVVGHGFHECEHICLGRPVRALVVEDDVLGRRIGAVVPQPERVRPGCQRGEEVEVSRHLGPVGY